MIRQIFHFILGIILKIIEWFKDLFKKDIKKESNKNVNGTNYEKVKISFIGGIIPSILGDKTSYNEIKEVEKEVKELLQNINNLTYEEIIEETKELENKIKEIKKIEDNIILETPKELQMHERNIKLLKKQEDIVKSVNNIYTENIVELKKVGKKKKEVKVEPKKETLKEEPKEPKIEIIDVPTTEKKKIDKKENKPEEKKNVIKEIIEKILPKKIDNKDKKSIIPIIPIKTKGTKSEVNKEDKEDKEIPPLKDPKLEKYKNYVIDANKLLKEANKELKEMEHELTLNHDNLDNIKYKVMELKEKISLIKKEYNDFKHSDYIYIIEEDFYIKEKDEYDIVKDSKKIDECIDKCNYILQYIEYKKYYKKEEPKKEKKKSFEPKKPVLEEQPKVEVPKILLEIEEANSIIKKDIKEQKKEVKRMTDVIELTPLYEKKQKRLSFFDNFLTNTFKIGLSFLPLKIFRNRALGLLTTGYILNNRVRSMRRILNPNLECEYITFNRRIKRQIDIVNNYDTICNDSLYQISSLKEEFLRIYSMNLADEEIKKSYNKLLSLEEQILEQKNNLENTKVKLNNKIKVKRLY